MHAFGSVHPKTEPPMSSSSDAARIKSPKSPPPADQVAIATYSVCSATFHTLISNGFPSTAPFKTGPPKSDKSVDSIADMDNWDPSQMPEPTKTSPYDGSTQPDVGSQDSKIPFASKTPISSPTSNDEIDGWKITNW